MFPPLNFAAVPKCPMSVERQSPAPRHGSPSPRSWRWPPRCAWRGSDRTVSAPPTMPPPSAAWRRVGTTCSSTPSTRAASSPSTSRPWRSGCRSRASGCSASVGLVTMRSRRWLALFLVATAAWQGYVAWNEGEVWQGWPLAIPTGAALAAAILLLADAGLARGAALAVGVAGLLAAPATRAVAPMLSRIGSVWPMARLPAALAVTAPAPLAFADGLGDRRKLLAFLAAHRGATRYALATTSTLEASTVILRTGQPVMALGGYTGNIRILDGAELARRIRPDLARFPADRPGARQCSHAGRRPLAAAGPARRRAGGPAPRGVCARPRTLRPRAGVRPTNSAPWPAPCRCAAPRPARTAPARPSCAPPRSARSPRRWRPPPRSSR